MKTLLTWLHRLHCVAFAGRGANMTVTTVEATITAAHCKRCGHARSLSRAGHFYEGDFFSVSHG